MTKKEIRKVYGERRINLADAELLEKTGQILDNFTALKLDGVQWLLSYYPLSERKEFNVALCEQLLQLDNPLIRIAWPKLQEDLVSMEAIEVNRDSVLEKNQYNIMEPVRGEHIGPQLIDAVFVPLLAFDNKGYRTGYGKGYYDRYLSRCAQDVVKIGFSFFEPVDNIDDINEFDVPLNYCITPMRVYEF